MIPRVIPNIIGPLWLESGLTYYLQVSSASYVIIFYSYSNSFMVEDIWITYIYLRVISYELEIYKSFSYIFTNMYVFSTNVKSKNVL